MVEVTLFCFIVLDGSVVPVEIKTSKFVGSLKEAIAKKLNYTGRADKLQLSLAKKDGAWLRSDDPDVISMRSGAISDQMKEVLDEEIDPTEEIGELFGGAPTKKTIHVLVVVPKQESTGKRTRVNEWFVDDELSVKKRKVDKDGSVDERGLRYFRMSSFPPLAHPEEQYKTIVERASSIVIFTELMKKVKFCFDSKSGGNFVVTGNPGTGKSRFYLYCIFKLLRRDQVEVQKLPSFELVLNFRDRFHKYCATDKEFIALNEADVVRLSDQPSVIRLIEGKSSQLTGWRGVSILFASPGLSGLSDYAKTKSYMYIMPTWSLAELQDYNSLLSAEWKIDKDVLISRYDKFGGIPRFIFTVTERENDEELNKAIATFSALDIISYAKNKHAVRDGNYSHRVLEMVPSTEDFRAKFHLDFLSKYIAEEIVFKVSEESTKGVGIRDSTRCRQLGSLQKERTLQLRPLCSGQPLSTIIIPEKLPTVYFSSLNDIEVLKDWTYYRPKSKTFGALDAFIVTGGECLGLQMTLNQQHGIKTAPLNGFLKWLEDAGIDANRLQFAFIVPSNLESSFKKQTMLKTDGAKNTRPGAAGRVNQFVAALDVFFGDN